MKKTAAQTLSIAFIAMIGVTLCSCGDNNQISESSNNISDSISASSNSNVESTSIVHEFENPTYEWKEDYSECTAFRKCIDDESLSQSETSKSIYIVITEPTASSSGVGRYEVSFINEAFEPQSIEVSIPYVNYEVTELIYNEECNRNTLMQYMEDFNYTLVNTETTETSRYVYTYKFDNGHIYYHAVYEDNGVIEEEEWYFIFTRYSYKPKTDSWQYTVFTYNEEEDKFDQGVSEADPWDFMGFPYYSYFISFDSFVYNETTHNYECESVSFTTSDQVEWHFSNISLRFENNDFVYGEDDNYNSEYPEVVHTTYSITDRYTTEVDLPDGAVFPPEGF